VSESQIELFARVYPVVLFDFSDTWCSSVAVYGAVLGVVVAKRVRGANIAVYRKLRLSLDHGLVIMPWLSGAYPGALPT
jgi:hypothetical protein